MAARWTRPHRRRRLGMTMGDSAVAVSEEAGELVAGPAASSAASTGFGSYLFAHGAWFLAFGVQAVLFPYLVRVVLRENEIAFGIAQMSLQLPTTLLILIGGFVADRVDGRRTIVLAFVATMATFLA